MKNVCFIVIVFFVLAFPLQAQLFEFSAKDAAKLANRELIVVLSEEDPVKLKQLTKSPEKLAAYKSLVRYSTAVLKKAVDRFWKTGQPISFKTKAECLSLSTSSEAYYTLDFASFWQNENTQLFRLNPDSSSVYAARYTLMQRKEFGYFELKLIEKFKATPFYSFQTPSSVPNEYDFATATIFISALVNEKLANTKFSTRNYELKIQQDNALLASKVLWVDSAIVNRQGKSYTYIAEEYDSASVYKLVDAKTLGQQYFMDDSSAVILSVVPYVDPISRGQSYIGTSGGSLNEYEKIIYYMQLILDPSSGAVLYYDKSEESVVLVKDWKRFQRYSRESSFKMPQFNNTTTPTQEKHYQQNQY